MTISCVTCYQYDYAYWSLEWTSGCLVRSLQYLFEGHEDLLPLAEVPEEEVQGSRHQGRVVMHGQMEQDPQEGATSVVIQVQGCVLLTR